jgi:hypothetical protein
VTAVFAAFAVIGLGVVYIGPLGSLFSSSATAAVAPPATLYAMSAADVQKFEAAGTANAQPTELERGTYTVYVPPKPTPTAAAAPQAATTSSAASSIRLIYTGGGSPAEWMAAAGIAQSDWGYVDYIVSRESGWNPNATNRSSGACGLVQALPCSKVPGNGYDPVDNLRWGTGYANGRYGGWAGAYAFWSTHHWW